MSKVAVWSSALIPQIHRWPNRSGPRKTRASFLPPLCLASSWPGLLAQPSLALPTSCLASFQSILCPNRHRKLFKMQIWSYHPLLLNTLGSNSWTTAQILNSLTPKISPPSSPNLWFPSKHHVLKLYWSFLTLSSLGQLQIAVSVLEVFSCLGCSSPLPPLAREHLCIAQSSKQHFPCTPS